MPVKHRRPTARYDPRPPSAFSVMKWKTNVLVRGPVVKWRDMLAFTSVVVQRYSKLIGKCLRLLVNEMYITLDSLALPVMRGVRDLVQVGVRSVRRISNLSVTEVLKFVNWDLFSNTVVAYCRLVLQQGIKRVPI